MLGVRASMCKFYGDIIQSVALLKHLLFPKALYCTLDVAKELDFK